MHAKTDRHIFTIFFGNISDGTEETNGYMREVVDIQKLLWSFVAVT